MTFTCMLEMWFFRYISKNIPLYRMLKAKYVMHIKGGKQKLSNMESLVKQVLRDTGLWIDTIWLSETAPQQRWCFYIQVLGISILLIAFPVIKRDATKKSCGRHITILFQPGRENYLGNSDGMYRPGGIVLVLQ